MSSTRIVVADTSVLINFLHLGRLDLLELLPATSSMFRNTSWLS